ncbi:hypothetical protein R2Q81_06100 [Microbacterium aquimaris]|uniref:hypothetical protein n=1 Tax=Microbacterium aquimaris TaxID=459816 RepID=UPI002AD448CF|nr:hypothetical protein [Microbacterium aquimaris]MDZ8275523.1 hypothetical protein [Microbacterium aquimaris]
MRTRAAIAVAARTPFRQLLIPALIDLWRQGRFPLDRLIRRYPFTSIDRALDDAARGVTVKPVLAY